MTQTTKKKIKASGHDENSGLGFSVIDLQGRAYRVKSDLVAYPAGDSLYFPKGALDRHPPYEDFGFTPRTTLSPDS